MSYRAYTWLCLAFGLAVLILALCSCKPPAPPAPPPSDKPHAPMIVIVSGKGQPQLTKIADSLKTLFPEANVIDFGTGPDSWRADVVSYVRENAKGPLVLIGHSWGSGALFTIAPHIGRVEMFISLDGCRHYTEHSEFIVTPNIVKCINITGDFSGLIREPIKGPHLHYMVHGGHVAMTTTDETVGLVELLVREALK